MRILGEIPHPQLKIQVFKMGNKFAIKLETDLLEQTYKMRESSSLNSFSDVQKVVDEPFLTAVSARFQTMRDDLSAAVARAYPVDDEEEFPYIL